MSSSFDIKVANGAPLRFRGGVETGAPQQQEPHAGGIYFLSGDSRALPCSRGGGTLECHMIWAGRHEKTYAHSHDWSDRYHWATAVVAPSFLW
jgi:hypothetical protein